MGVPRLTLRQERDAVAAVVAGEPIKAAARTWGLPYTTMRDIVRRHGVPTRATDDPERLRQRERWRRNTAAYRARRATEGSDGE